MSGSGDVISVEEFRAEAIAFLDGHATPKPRGAGVRVGRGRRRRRRVRREGPRRRGRGGARRRRSGGPSVRQRLRLDPRAREVRWPRPDRRARRRAYDSLESRYETPNMGVFTISLGMVAPTILAHATPEVQDALPPRPLPGRHGRVPAVQRAGRRLRPRRPPDPRRPRRRRVDPQRPEGLDVAARTTPTSARSSAAPIPTSRSTRASPGSWSTCGRPASRSDRCAR